MQKTFDQGDVLLRVHPDVVKTLKEHECALADGAGRDDQARTIIVKSDPSLHPEQFDIH